MRLYIHKYHKDAIMPSKNRTTDAGWDLYSVEDVLIKPGERKPVPIGLNIVCEEGYFYTFAPRSGIAFKKNIIPSHLNVMDSFYTGDCSVLMHNRSDEEYEIKKGDKFCQIIIFEVPSVNMVLISGDELNEISCGRRGTRGFGSSGN